MGKNIALGIAVLVAVLMSWAYFMEMSKRKKCTAQLVKLTGKTEAEILAEATAPATGG